MRADIINLSLAIGNDNGHPEQAIVESVERAAAAGVILVVAAGNSGPTEGTMSQIATLPSVISVGSSNWEGTRVSSFSSRGLRGKPRSGPTIVAPGEDVIGAWIIERQKSPEQAKRDEKCITCATLERQTGRNFEGRDLVPIRNLYTVMSGTSQACAYITGLLGRFVELRRTIGLPHDSSHAIGFLQRAARKIKGCPDHAQGSGFVSLQVIQDYLRAIQPGDLFWGSTDCRVEEVWEGAKGDGVCIGICDTGQPNHPHIETSASKDFTNSKSGVWDKHGHSTHITGIIAGR